MNRSLITLILPFAVPNPVENIAMIVMMIVLLVGIVAIETREQCAIKEEGVRHNVVRTLFLLAEFAQELFQHHVA